VWNSRERAAMQNPSNSATPETVINYSIMTDAGLRRAGNEDACGSYEEGPEHVVLAVADGVGGEEGGEVASQTAIQVTLRVYRESPRSWGAPKRLYRAVQQANIEIHDRALVVTELRRMATTLTAIVIDGAVAHAAHVGDSRLYLVRGNSMVQKTKDHTVASGRQRMGLLTAEGARMHPERSTLTRCLGRELIAAVDRIAFPITGGDALVLCTDGLYNVLNDAAIQAEAGGRDSSSACRALLDRANAIGTPDNLTVAIARITGRLTEPPPSGLRALLSRVLG
jgi:serine/threonine protein phosphatase PrpC